MIIECLRDVFALGQEKCYQACVNEWLRVVRAFTNNNVSL